MFSNNEDFSAQLKKTAKTIASLSNIAATNPEKEAEIFTFLKNNIDLIKDVDDLSIVATTFPERTNELFELMLQHDPQKLSDLLKTSDDVEVMAISFPDKKQDIFKLLIQLEVFQRIVETKQDLDKLKRMFVNNGFNIDILKQATVKDAIAMLHGEKAHTRGATAGMFASHFPKEIGSHIGSFLTEKEGGQVARSSKEASANATEEQDRVKNMGKGAEKK